MKKILLTLITNLLILSSSIAQIPKEAFPLTNSLSDLWQNGDTEKAIESSMELYRLYPPMFIDRIHNTLAQKLQGEKKQNCITYLEQLFQKNNEEINQIITPVLLWSKALNANEPKELTSIVNELNTLIKDSSHYSSRAERYILLILKELDKKNAIDNNSRKQIINKNIISLGTYPFIEKVISDRGEAEKRAWNRYLLAYSYDYLYSNVINEETYLKRASDYSPDLNDRLYKHAYFYDAALLTGNTKQIGFKSKYWKYLNDNNRKPEVLILLCDITFSDPTDNNITELKNYYENSGNTAPFKSYWMNYINSMGKAVPMIKLNFEKEELNLTKKPDCWIYIDVWGTWCSPCRKELPELQSLYFENNKVSDSNLKIYSFSYSSQNLINFMNENNYTFPVCEIDKEVNDLFEITGYPTKILISPEGNYIKIPFGLDWKMFVKNYTLI